LKRETAPVAAKITVVAGRPATQKLRPTAVARAGDTRFAFDFVVFVLPLLICIYFLVFIDEMNTRRRPIAPSPNIYATNAKICHLVAQHPCLYDRSDENYMRKSTVINAWKDISKDMRISGGFIIPACMVGID